MTFKVMSFNMQKDRNHSVQYEELLHFMSPAQHQWADAMILNEAYYLHPEVAQAALTMDYHAFHPNQSRGMNWNAVLLAKAVWQPLDEGVTCVAEDGYENTPPRYAVRVHAQKIGGDDAGERVMFYAVHYPPSWQWGILTKHLVRERVRNALEMNRKIWLDVVNQKRLHPKTHFVVAGDFNYSSLSGGKPYAPIRHYREHMRLQTIWNQARAKRLGIKRPIDDVFHSAWLQVKHVELAGFEKSDHEPPIVNLAITKHLR